MNNQENMNDGEPMVSDTHMISAVLAAWPLERTSIPDLVAAHESFAAASPFGIGQWLSTPHATTLSEKSESLALLLRTGRHPFLPASTPLSSTFPPSTLSGLRLKTVSVAAGASPDAARRAVFELDASLSEFCHRTGIPENHPLFSDLSFALYPHATASLSHFDSKRLSIEVFGRGGDVAASLFRFFLSFLPAAEINGVCASGLGPSPVDGGLALRRKKSLLDQSATQLKNLMASPANDDDLESRLFRRHRLFVKWRNDMYKGASSEAARASWNRWRTGNRIALSPWRDSRDPVVLAWSREERIIDTLLFRRGEWSAPSWVLRTIPDFIATDFLDRSDKEALLAAASAQAVRDQAGRDGWLATSAVQAPHGMEAFDFSETFSALCRLISSH